MFNITKGTSLMYKGIHIFLLVALKSLLIVVYFLYQLMSTI